jgi:hypothetical protein
MSISCLSVKRRLKDKQRFILNKKIDSMYELDQGVRYAMSNLDSIYKVDWKSNGKPLFAKEKRKKLGEKYGEYRRKNDSLRNLMQRIDNSNTNKLLQLTNQYGFPSKDRLKAIRASAYFIFVHSPKKYRQEIRELITSEYKNKRISEYEKAYIFWHINGRKEFPPRMRQDGSIIYGKKIRSGKIYKVNKKK